ncbi:MAG: hypothetical protein HKN51_17290 [Saprospiraceae bacterium]|nr:hypothetical protein [Saprospiraceae bacterium]
MNQTLTYAELSLEQKSQYKNIVEDAFPKLIFQSSVVKTSWIKIEKYFPSFQRFLINEQNNILGLINTIPFFWDHPLSKLPDQGWDWLVKKGIGDFENGISPNHLGGLQIIVAKSFLNKGISKLLIAEGKKIMSEYKFRNFAIPIRPTFKSHYPEMAMDEYLNFKKEDKIFDPWIRTHLNSGAKVIKVCNNSMKISGRINFWKGIYKRETKQHNYWIVEGALNPILIKPKQDIGVYNEANIWIYYN